MTDVKPKYANFPERELKVVIGPNINASTTKTLTRMSIGTYEMSFTQQEKGTATTEATRLALSTLGRATGLTVTKEAHRDFVACFVAQNAEHKYQIWISTPFELTQAGHIVWVKYTELGSEGKIGVAFKLSTGFNADDVTNVVKAAQKAAVKLEAGEPFTIKGNPPPRFVKKTKATDAAAEAPADGSDAAPASPETANPAG
ncbi:MAG: hypothetical protein H0V44_03965 [Planctomycetes bacterium]|nr:hypothetical protein [Planctomycetota bacterium]